MGLTGGPFTTVREGGGRWERPSDLLAFRPKRKEGGGSRLGPVREEGSWGGQVDLGLSSPARGLIG
jgi:hypothetical protein